jgi:TctA family transporter
VIASATAAFLHAPDLWWVVLVVPLVIRVVALLVVSTVVPLVAQLIDPPVSSVVVPAATVLHLACYYSRQAVVAEPVATDSF